MTDFCMQCPRKCGIDRATGVGYCGAGGEIRLARAALHLWEEPCISGEGGSGALFFVGCNLRCVFCQNRSISQGDARGIAVSEEELERIMLRLQAEGAESLSLVTPTPYADRLVFVLERVKPQLNLPVVYNCGGYESVETLRRLEGLVDVYLPDCKYFSPELASLYSDAPDYFSVATDAIAEMLRQTGKPQFDARGILRRGVVVRHLVLPGCRQDSEQLLKALHERFGGDAFLLSLMNQYTPAFAPPDAPKNLHRRVTSFEYSRVAETVEQLKFAGYFQDRSASDVAYTPDFEGEGYKTVIEKMTPGNCEKRRKRISGLTKRRKNDII